MNTDRFVRRVMGLLVLAMILIAVIDALTGRELSLWIAYVAPVAVGAWLLGFRCGFYLSLLAGTLLLTVGLRWGNLYSSEWFFVYAITCRTACFIFIAWLCHRLRRVQELESKVQAYEELYDSLHMGISTPHAETKNQDTPHSA